MSALPFGPLDADALFVCIDMQRLFLEPGEWYCEDGLAILPAVARLCAHAGSRCLYTRFVTAVTPEDATGQWQRYYRRWRAVTREVIGDEAMELHASLSPDAVRARTFDKTTHDAFDGAPFASFVAARRPSALVLFGIETDVCVLATALSATNLGYRTTIVTDAVASSDRASHAACLELVYPRFDQQIELAGADRVIAASVGHGG